MRQHLNLDLYLRHLRSLLTVFSVRIRTLVERLGHRRTHSRRTHSRRTPRRDILLCPAWGVGAASDGGDLQPASQPRKE